MSGKCDLCGKEKKVEKKLVCVDCSRQEIYKSTGVRCSICKKYKKSAIIIKGEIICNTCYKWQGSLKTQCSVCGQTKTVRFIENKPVCRKCYQKKILFQKCFFCQKVKKVKHRFRDGKVVCEQCFTQKVKLKKYHCHECQEFKIAHARGLCYACYQRFRLAGKFKKI